MGNLLLLWGKADRRFAPGPHPLLCHLLDAAAVGEALLPRFASPLPLPPPWIAYLVGLHDVGKADPLFQNKSPECARRLRAAGLLLPEATVPFRHEARSAECVFAHLQQDHHWERAAALLASQAVAGHHGHFQPDDAHLDTPAQQRPEWARLRGRLAAALAAALALPPHAPRFPEASRAGAALTGLIVLADWIASNEEVFHSPPPAAPSQYLEAAREEAHRAVRRLGLGVTRDPRYAARPPRPLAGEQASPGVRSARAAAAGHPSPPAWRGAGGEACPPAVRRDGEREADVDRRTCAPSRGAEPVLNGVKDSRVVRNLRISRPALPCRGCTLVVQAAGCTGPSYSRSIARLTARTPAPRHAGRAVVRSTPPPRQPNAVTPAPPALPTFRQLWPHCARLRPVQRALEIACRRGLPPGLAIIEAPTGDGKTEAAIYLAEHWRRASGRDGLYLALPTAAASTQMHARYADFLRRRRPEVQPLLVHGLAWLCDDASPVAGSETDGGAEERDLTREWFRGPRRALLAPEGVGTVDQAMLAALHVKHGVLRLLGLSAKVLIIDEVHAYDEYMATILCRLLRWCRALETPVILLSATLSSPQKRQLAEAYGGPGALPRAGSAYPLITFVPYQGPPRTLPVLEARPRRIVLRRHYGLLRDPGRVADLALSAVRAGGCACVLVNTVIDAQAVYRQLQRRGPSGAALMLFHARFRAERRRQLEDALVQRFGPTGDRPARAILVATQVVEQSLDVDFDVMLSQLAPVDLLLQRAGRLQRHDRGPRPTGPEPVLHLLLPPAGHFGLGAIGLVYHRLPLLRTLALLHGRDAFDLPRDFRTLVEACYCDGPVPAGAVPPPLLAAAERERQHVREAAEAAARLHLIPEPSPREFRLALAAAPPVAESDEGEAGDYFHACTRLGAPHTRTLVLHDADLVEAARRETAPDRETLRRLLLQLVDLPAWWLRGLTPAGDFAPIAAAPRWLNRWVIVPMQEGEWRGTDSRGHAVTLRDDAMLGLMREGETDGA